MEIVVYQRVNVSGLNPLQIEMIREANATLKSHEHAPDCPVYCGASMDCVWPFAVCYVACYPNIYHLDVKKDEP